MSARIEDAVQVISDTLDVVEDEDRLAEFAEHRAWALEAPAWLAARDTDPLQVAKVAARHAERMGDDFWYETPITDEQVAELRAWMIRNPIGNSGATRGFTCDDCGARRQCSLVFDSYNTDGDCLAMK